MFDSVGGEDGSDVPHSFPRHRVLENECPVVRNGEYANSYHCGVDGFGCPSAIDDDNDHHDHDGGFGGFGVAALAHHYGRVASRIEHGNELDDDQFDRLVDICAYVVVPLEWDEGLPMVLVV